MDGRIKVTIWFPYWIQIVAKWLVCSWLHYKYRCYPECDRPNTWFNWHCQVCHSCADDLDRMGISTEYKWVKTICGFSVGLKKK